MSNNSNISSNWAGFHKLWTVVAILLFLALLALMMTGYSPLSPKAEIPPTIVEKVIEKEKLVDNPELLTRIDVLEKENEKIAVLTTENAKIADLKTNIVDLKTNIVGLTKSSGLVAGLQAKIKALEAVDLNFENPALTSRINLLETENASIAGMKKRILEFEATNTANSNDKTMALTKRVVELEAENGLIAGLKAKVSALEAIDVNFMKPQDSSKLVQKINNLEIKTLVIPSLESRIQSLQAEKSVLNKRIDDLVEQNGLIAGLKAKVSALEAIDINFIQPKDSSVVKGEGALMKRIGDLETQNGMIPGLKAKIKALEAIDINFMSNDSIGKSGGSSSSSMIAVPQAAKLYFQPGSSRSPTDVSQSMADVIVFLRSNPSSQASLAGFHDAAGNANWNRRLAIKRSNRVKQIIIDAGISSDRIYVEIPTQTLGTGLPEEARRVEVKVSK